MRLSFLPAAALVAACAGALLAAPAAPSLAAASCEAEPLAEALHERMKGEGKSDAEIGEILASGFKRRVLKGRVVDGSDCSAEQVDEALDRLETTTRS